ncbi:MAG: glycosyltransferase family 39 protein [Bacteroidetes bacterium]|nr:glycosyltransferase family 39 protein [Bacteroidota bacterium]
MSLFKKIKKLNTNWIIVITLISITWVNFNIVRWQKGNIISYDVGNYYSYLPAVFYEHDLSLSFLNDTLNKQTEQRYYWPNKDVHGNKVIKMTMGMAFTYLPFFGLAHVYCKLVNEPANGFSDPYHFAIQFASLFYFLIGLIFLLRVLKLFYNDKTVFITALLIVFGTNIIYYLTNGAGMSHATTFSFVSAFIYYTIKWHQTQTFRSAFMIGVLGGMITLIRPINIMVFIAFFLYEVNSIKELSAKIKLLLENHRQILLIVLLGILIFLPQLIYWKWVSGSYFINSYVGERFYFNNPHIINGLFSFRKGWLIYTPIMAFSLIGFYYLRKTTKAFFTALIVFTPIYLYVVFSWWCWWYGGSFGQRALIDIYPLLALPFAAFVAHVQSLGIFKRSVVYTLMVLFLLLNIFQTMQAKWNTIHFDSMTRDAYFDAFLRLTKNPEREQFLKHPDEDKAKQGIDEY